MERRTFFGIVLAGLASMTGLLAGGCVPMVAESALEPQFGDPWRCTYCWHLFRTTEDMTGKKCPRCKERKLVKISEEEMKRRLEEAEEEG